jgi:Protein of unknown function (DUF4058)
MPSPFPGMDPYLEDPAFWSDFHRRFITYISNSILEHLPDGYDARIDEKIRVVIPEETGTRYYPDVAITGGPTAATAKATIEEATAAVVDLVQMNEIEEERDVWIEVLRRPGRELVTVIELLSPSNKVGGGLRDYTARRDEFLLQHVHFVEINLLVGGQRPPIASPWPPGEYYTLIARTDQHPKASVIRWNLRDPLPPIPIPLVAPDPDVTVDLKQVFSRAYDEGRYRRALNYLAPLTAPLSAADKEWAAGVARSAR